MSVPLMVDQAFTSKDLNIIIYGVLQDLHAARAEINRLENTILELRGLIYEQGNAVNS